MAPSDSKDGAQKYSKLTFVELKDECEKRQVKFNESDGKNELIDLLQKADHKPPDWGKIYSKLLYHYHMDYDSVKKRAIPQVETLLLELPEQISMSRLSIPGLFGGLFDGQANPADETSPTGKPPKLSEFATFVSAFND